MLNAGLPLYLRRYRREEINFAGMSNGKTWIFPLDINHILGKIIREQNIRHQFLFHASMGLLRKGITLTIAEFIDLIFICSHSKEEKKSSYFSMNYRDFSVKSKLIISLFQTVKLSLFVSLFQKI